MRRCVALLTAGLVLFLASPASAGPQALSFEELRYNIQNPVEQQTLYTCNYQNPCPDRSVWIVNPTGCVWDADDMNDRFAAKEYLDAGASVTESVCLIGDNLGLITGTPHYAGVTLRAPSAGLSVRLSLSPGWSRTAQPVWNASARAYYYTVCAQTPDYRHSDSLVVDPIPDSNGGWGVPTTASLSVSNPTGKRVRDVTAYWGLANLWTRHDIGCP